MNRVRDILLNPLDSARDDAYWRIYHDLLRPKGGPPLDGEETSSVFEFLHSNALALRERAWLWKLLLLGTPTPEVRDQALVCLDNRNENGYLRGLAFLYLRTHAPELVPELVTRYADDPTPRVRYHIASTLNDPDRRRAVMEAILPDIEYDHELYDAILLEL